MSLNVRAGGKDYDFEGPYADAGSLKAESGVYVVTTKNSNGKHKVLDAGESVDVQGRVSHHDRSAQWERHKLDGLYYSAYYCSESERTKLEKGVRDEYNPPCGER
jgi:hypothetical protein